MIGARFGSWIIDRELGRGGMGEVYLAHRAEPADGADRAALKVLAPALAQDPGFQLRFQREIDVLGKLDHPNIVRFFDAGTHDNHSYYAMEYVEGRSFEELLLAESRLPWRDVLAMALQVSLALKHAHDRGIIHRDLKPSNLLRAADGTVKLTDFGIAKVFAGTHLTATGGVVGTAEYLSPEQATGKPVTKRSDLYSLGVVLYTLLTGRTPFEGDNLVDILHKHRFAQFDLPRKLVPDLPHDLEAVVCQLLAKDPAERPADGLVLHRQLERIRRKLERKAKHTMPMLEGEADLPATQISSPGPGPATLMSRLLRAELEGQNKGGPLKRFINKPVVLVLLFVLCTGLIVWGLWPPSAELLFQRGAALMRSEDPDDWETAWSKYFEPLRERFPEHVHQEEVQEFWQRIEDQRAQKESAKAARSAGVLTEAQWFYEEGLRQRQQGHPAAAEETWRSLMKLFDGVDSEKPWVELARKELEGSGAPEPAAQKRWQPVRKALARARQLRDDGKRGEAEEVWRGVEALYRDDPSAQGILDELRRDRGE
jgi:serine/threonine-protein kinase